MRIKREPLVLLGELFFTFTDFFCIFLFLKFNDFQVNMLISISSKVHNLCNVLIELIIEGPQ